LYKPEFPISAHPSQLQWDDTSVSAPRMPVNHNLSDIVFTYCAGVMPKLWNETVEAHRRAVRDAILETTWALVAETAIDRAIRLATIRHGLITQQSS
jgi:hypothetical protein